MLFLWLPLPDVGDRDQLIEQQIPGVSSFNYELKLELASFLEKSVSHDLLVSDLTWSQVTHSGVLPNRHSNER